MADNSGEATSESGRPKLLRGSAPPIGRRLANRKPNIQVEERLSVLRQQVWNKHRVAKRTWLAEQERNRVEVPVIEVEAEPRNEPLIALFRRIGGIVRTLCQMFIWIKKRNRSEIATAFIAPAKTSSSSDHSDGRSSSSLYFSPAVYKARTEYFWPHFALNAITKTPKTRSEEDCQIIRKVMRTLPCFWKYSNTLQILISRVAEYFPCPGNRVILRSGHRGDLLYFIFSGSVNVVYDHEVTNVFKHPKMIMLKKGDTFGEIALITGATRTATIVSCENCEFICVDKTAFEEHGLYALFMIKSQDTIDFLSHLPIFESWPRSSIETLCLYSRTEHYHYRKVVASTFHTSKWLYFIIKGSCEVMQLVDITKCGRFAMLVPQELIDDLTEKFDHVFFDLTTLHDFIKAAHDKIEMERRAAQKRAWAKLAKANEGHLSTSSEEDLISTDRDSRYHTRSTTNVCENTESQPPSALPAISRKPSFVDQRISLSDETMAKIFRYSLSTGRRNALIDDKIDSHFRGVGVFVKVNTLTSGDVFGFQSDDDKIRLTLLSEGCELIRVPMARFQSMCDYDTQQKISKLICDHPSEDQLTADIFKEARWNVFRTDLADSTRNHTVFMRDYFRRPTIFETFGPKSEMTPAIYISRKVLPSNTTNVDVGLDRSFRKPRTKTALLPERNGESVSIRPIRPTRPRHWRFATVVSRQGQ